MRGLRFRLASLFLLAVLPGLLAAATYNFLDYRDMRASEAARLLGRTRVLGARNGVLLESVERVLDGLAKREDIRKATENPAACAQTLAGATAIHPELAHIGVFTPDGELVCASPGGGLFGNEYARPWFAHVMETRQFAIGEYRRFGQQNHGAVQVGYPLLRGDGTAVGAIGAGVDIGWLSERFGQLALEPGVELSLFDRNGTALARYPDPDRLVGRSLPFVARRIADTSEGFDETEFLDHTDRIAAFAPLGGRDWHDLTVSIDIDPAVLLATARWNLALDLASLSSVVLIGAFAAFYWGGKLFIRPIEEIGRVASHLAAGNMTARVGGPYADNELGRVARAFDSMAEALCSRDQELRRANAYKSRVLAVAGHDLRQPLQIIAMSHDLIGRALNSPKLKLQLARADAAIERLMRQLDLITSAGRLDESAPEPTIEAVPLGRAIAQTAAEHATLAEAKGIGLRIVATAAIAWTDAEMLATILRNLIGNAVKYTERGGVVVGCRRLGATLAIDVCDTGIGIPEDQIAAVFEDFYQLDPRSAGLGLGLAIVRRTAEVLGHRLEVRSELGRGSRFRLLLDRAARPVPAEALSA